MSPGDLAHEVETQLSAGAYRSLELDKAVVGNSGLGGDSEIDGGDTACEGLIDHVGRQEVHG